MAAQETDACVLVFSSSFFHTFISFWFSSNFFTKKKFVRLEFGDDYEDNMPAGNDSTVRITECRTRTSKPFNLYYIINFIERLNHFPNTPNMPEWRPFFLSIKKNLSEIMFAFMDLSVNCMSIAWRWNAKTETKFTSFFSSAIDNRKGFDWTHRYTIRMHQYTHTHIS